ncbi:MAG TPA: MoxR family ATPase [Candidatus Limnocylindrales bacterium]|jgi:MoxR-like ATPase|nr:MoxR family ATPase [Candidatus Limnocylindrales bacterium]
MSDQTPTTAPAGEMTAERFSELAAAIEREVGAFIVGQQQLVRQTLISLLAGSHALLEGVPGLGKTMLVRTMAEALDLGFSRIQFTPDLMPADIVGTNIIVEEGGERRFRFQQGPIFSNLVLADEINRATPKTQSALLEAMQEHRVTVAKQQYTLSEPFFVLATQNPLEMEGTYPLPEAQLDRFFFKIDVPFPSEEDLVRIMERTTGVETPTVGKAATGSEVLAMQHLARDVPIASHVMAYAIRILRGTHPETERVPEIVRTFVRYGASPRGAQAMVLGSKINALLDGRFNVAYSDVQAVAAPALRHRVILNFEGEAEGISTDAVVRAIVAETPTEPAE